MNIWHVIIFGNMHIMIPSIVVPWQWVILSIFFYNICSYLLPTAQLIPAQLLSIYLVYLVLSPCIACRHLKIKCVVKCFTTFYCRISTLLLIQWLDEISRSWAPRSRRDRGRSGSRTVMPQIIFDYSNINYSWAITISMSFSWKCKWFLYSPPFPLACWLFT